MTKKRNSILCFLVLLVFILIINSIIIFADTFEPNDTSTTATVLTFTRLLTYADSYISTSSDVDFYKINISHTGLYSCSLVKNDSASGPYGDLPADYDMEIYNPSVYWITGSYNSGTSPEQCYFNVSTAGYYYVRIYGHNGAYSPGTAYKLVLLHGDSTMFMEAFRYYYYNGYAFCDRLDPGSTWHSRGVAYGYGSKDSLSHYKNDIYLANAYASTPYDNWSDYSSSYPRPGKYSSDGVSTDWCGIDCSGLIQRCAQAAGDRYVIARNSPLDSGDGLSGYTRVPSGDFGNYSSPVSWPGLETGDIAYWSGHIVMLSRVSTSSEGDCQIIEAAGDSLANGGRVVKESYLSKYNGYGYTLGRLDQ